MPMILSRLFSTYDVEEIIRIFRLLSWIYPIIFVGLISANGFLNPLGFASITLKITFIAAVLNLVLDYYFINLFGFIGVIYVTVMIHSTSIIVEHTLFYFKFREKYLVKG